MMTLLLSHGALGWVNPGWIGARRAVAVGLAPREALVEEYERLAGESGIDVGLVAESSYVEELLRAGDLDREELETMFAEESASSAALGLDGFVRLCERIDDLFEAEDDEVFEDVVSRVAALVPETGCVVRSDYEASDEIAEALEELEADAEPTEAELAGDWELAYVSSPSFHFNGGYTGVAKTTPGGAEFVALRQTLRADDGAGVAAVVETLRPGVGDPFDVDVSADWRLVRRVDPLTLDSNLHLDLVPRSVKYGFVSVDGDRVEKGWKAMRALNSAILVHADPSLRIQRGVIANTWFVWRSRAA